MTAFCVKEFIDNKLPKNFSDVNSNVWRVNLGTEILGYYKGDIADIAFYLGEHTSVLEFTPVIITEITKNHDITCDHVYLKFTNTQDFSNLSSEKFLEVITEIFSSNKNVKVIDTNNSNYIIRLDNTDSDKLRRKKIKDALSKLTEEEKRLLNLTYKTFEDEKNEKDEEDN